MSTYRRWITDTVNNGVAWKTPCICSYQLCIKSEVCCGTVGHCGDSWKLRWVAGEARNMMENALSILIVIFSVQLQQTEISERKLFIFQHGNTILLWPLHTHHKTSKISSLSFYSFSRSRRLCRVSITVVPCCWRLFCVDLKVS